jgi:hypothetical protein
MTSSKGFLSAVTSVFGSYGHGQPDPNLSVGTAIHLYHPYRYPSRELLFYIL